MIIFVLIWLLGLPLILTGVAFTSNNALNEWTTLKMQTQITWIIEPLFGVVLSLTIGLLISLLYFIGLMLCWGF
jgi:phosphate/sulfate permease